MQAQLEIGLLLRSGDRRTVGNVPQVVRIVSENLDRLPDLLECLFDELPAVRMRAADALEKLSRVHDSELQPYVAMLLSLLEKTEQPEVQWHLAVILPRLRLSSAQCRCVAERLQACLESRSSIVKTAALQGLVDLTKQQPSLRPVALALLRSAERSGTPAMRARSRKLLVKMENRESDS